MSLVTDINHPDINKGKVFIFGSKMNFEQEFYFQIVDSEKKKNRLESHFLSKPNMNWFVLEVLEVPVFMKASIEKKEYIDTIIAINEQTSGMWKANPLIDKLF